MSNRMIHINDKNADIIAFNRSLISDSNNSKDLTKMKKIISRAFNEELTEKQKACIIGYYVDRKRMKTIAEEMGVVPSTVTRHIKNAKRRLRHIAKYYI